MSCFPGRMREYKEVSIDRFDGENLSSTVYFLSHNHSDHTVGLASSDMLYRLESNSHVKFYCSEVTKELLAAETKYEKLIKFITGLPTEDPQYEEICHTTIPVPDSRNGKEKYKVNVTLLPAAHCPGSVMFLFEGHEGTSLYTGDFRLSREELQAMPSLKCGSRAPVIDSLYVDTTFCVPQAFFIPSRDESADAITSLVEEWIMQSRQHLVILHCRANLGYEHIFRVLSMYFQTKIHVSRQQYDKYQRVPELAPYFTTDAAQTQIHACKWNPDRAEGAQLPCGYIPSGKPCLEVRTLSLSTMYFTQRVTNTSYVAKTKHSYRVCYSFHSSYSEIRDMLLYLQPRRAFPNVKPVDCTMETVQERLNQFLKLAKKSKPVTPNEQRVVPLGRLRRKRKKLFDSQSQKSDEGLVFDDEITTNSKVKVTKNEEMFSFTYIEAEEGDNDDENKDDLTDSQKSRERMQTSESDFTPVKTRGQRHDSLTSCGQPSSDSKPNSQNVQDSFCAENHVEGAVGADKISTHAELDMTQQDQELMQDFKPALSGSLGSFLAYASDIDSWSEVDEGEMPSLPTRIHGYQHDYSGLILSQQGEEAKNGSASSQVLSSQGNNSIDLFNDSLETDSQGHVKASSRKNACISSVAEKVSKSPGVATSSTFQLDNVTLDKGCDTISRKISGNANDIHESKNLKSASDASDCDNKISDSKTNKCERDHPSKTDNLSHLNKLSCGANKDNEMKGCSPPENETGKLCHSNKENKEMDSDSGKQGELGSSPSDTSIEEKDDDVIYVGETLEDPGKESDGYQCDAEDSDATVDESFHPVGRSPGSHKSTPQRKHRYKRSQLDSFHRANRIDEDSDESTTTTSTESSDVVIDLTADDSQAESAINFAGGSSDSYFYDSDQTIDYTRQNSQRGGSSSKRKNCNTGPVEDDVIVLDDESPEKTSTQIDTVEHIVSMGSDCESISKTDSLKNTGISEPKGKTSTSIKRTECTSHPSETKLKNISPKAKRTDQKCDKSSTSSTPVGSGTSKRKRSDTPSKTPEKRGKKTNGHASPTNIVSKIGPNNANTPTVKNSLDICMSGSQKSSSLEVKDTSVERESPRQDLDSMHIDLVLTEGVGNG